MDLAGHFTYKRLLRFTIAPILMLICGTIYGAVDAFFISNYIGKLPLAAVNIVLPLTLVPVAVGCMIGEGGNAMISKTLGEGKTELALQYFSMLVALAMVIGILISIIGVSLLDSILEPLGADDTMQNHCLLYGRIVFSGWFFYVLQNVFQCFFIVAGKPVLAFQVSLAGGIINILLDYLLIARLDYGLTGAACATLLGQIVCVGLAIGYFYSNNKSNLHFVRPQVYPRIILQTMLNGLSEMVGCLAYAITGILHNIQLMKYIGPDGVAAYGVIYYVMVFFLSIFFGYDSASNPLIAYQYGAKNYEELHNLVRKSYSLVVGSGVLMWMSVQLVGPIILNTFLGYDTGLLAMAQHGLQFISYAFFFMGINFFSSAMFTALNNGVVSGAISFLQGLVLPTISVLLLPKLLGANGVWLATVSAEAITLCVSVSLVLKYRKIYHY